MLNWTTYVPKGTLHLPKEYVDIEKVKGISFYLIKSIWLFKSWSAWKCNICWAIKLVLLPTLPIFISVGALPLYYKTNAYLPLILKSVVVHYWQGGTKHRGNFKYWNLGNLLLINKPIEGFSVRISAKNKGSIVDFHFGIFWIYI